VGPSSRGFGPSAPAAPLCALCPGGLGGEQWPITDGHRYAQPLAGGGCAASAWTWWAAVERVNLDIARSWVQTRAG